MTECDACKADVKVTKSLTLIPCPELCEDCFEYVIRDDLNTHTETDKDL